MNLVLLVVALLHCSVLIQCLAMPNAMTCSSIKYSVSLRVCQAGSKGQVTKLSRADSYRIKALYPQLFRSYTRKSILSSFAKPSFYVQSCCKTYVNHRAESFMKNVHGKERELVHLRTLYQFQYVTIGRCGRCPWGYSCSTKKTIQYLMVYDKPFKPYKSPMTFEAFEVPTYCECYRRYWRPSPYPKNPMLGLPSLTNLQTYEQ